MAGIELAPYHKEGLPLAQPLLVAHGTAELLALLDREALGAVIAPELGGPQRRPVRVLERPGGVLLEEGRGALSFSGLRRLVRAAGELPVIGTITAAHPRGAANAAGRLAGEGVRALLVDLPAGDPRLAEAAIAAVRDAVDLPLLAQVPLNEAAACAALAESAGADALVVAAPAQGLAHFDDGLRPVHVHGPLLQPLYLLAVQEVAQAVRLPIVARGGLLTPEDARAFIAAGAVAVVADTVASVSPAAVGEIGRGMGS
ncbi:MAG TPA: nitronate monooxygenase [Anaerolineae bacterium]|nr:nitronate monooxygenase [Anaerolineae bacterium]HPL27628.1 nitronate monooxygenase [Anaerolineae bacterium]